MVWPSAVFARASHRAEAGAVRAEGIAAPSARRSQVVVTIAVITPYYIYSVALMAQLRTLIAEMLSKKLHKSCALCTVRVRLCKFFLFNLHKL